jgi:putative tryptophan/tyrosine transport system substrate-binding protein
MKRNGFIKRASSVLLLTIMLTLTLGGLSRAQSTAVRRIGVLTPGGDFAAVVEGLRQGLALLGYEEGKQIAFIIEDTKMETVDPVKAAVRLVAAKPDLLVTVATSHTAAAKQATALIPIVFTVLADPVQSGFVASFASSKNNLTGVSNSLAALSGKRIELLKEMAPGIKRALAIVTTNEQIAQKTFPSLADAAQKFGIQFVRRDVAGKEDIENVLRDTPRGSVDAMILVPAILLRNNIGLLVDKAKKDKLPFGVHTEELVKKGALVSYGEDNRQIGIQTARLVAKVLKGVLPAEIPIETPERPVLVVNLTTAKTIGLKIPREFLEHVDRIVE